MAELFVLLEAGEERKGKAELWLSGACFCPSHIPHSLSSSWEQMQWPKEVQTVGAKQCLLKPKQALKSSKGGVGRATEFKHGHLPCTSSPRSFQLQVVERCRRWYPMKDKGSEHLDLILKAPLP